jgi:hypothetical protein
MRRAHHITQKMPSSGMLHRVAIVRIYDSEGIATPIIMVPRIGELGTTVSRNKQPKYALNKYYFFAACVGC